VEKVIVFVDRLEQFAQDDKVFSLVFHCGNLTLDVISSVVMDFDFGAQDKDHPSEFIRTYHELFETYAREQMDLPWFLTPRTEWKRRRLAKRIKRTLREIVRNAFDKRQTDSIKSRSVLSLSLQDIDTLTPRAVDEACDQLSTFLFAGHDTTSILLSWVFYELSRTPHALKALREELDSIFGPGECIVSRSYKMEVG
jgi:cytochrome P450